MVNISQNIISLNVVTHIFEDWQCNHNKGRRKKFKQKIVDEL